MFIKKKEGDIFKEEEKGPKDRRRSGREGAAPPRSSFEGERKEPELFEQQKKKNGKKRL